MKFQTIHLEVMSHHKRCEFRASPSDDKLEYGAFVLRLTVTYTEPFPFRAKVIIEFTQTKIVVSQQSPDDDVIAVEVFLICNIAIKRRCTSNTLSSNMVGKVKLGSNIFPNGQ